MLAEARIGTSGFAYREWMGSVYPRGATAAQLLPLYAERLPAVEIVSSFTRLPSTEQLASWAASVPQGFQFALKAPGGPLADQIGHLAEQPRNVFRLDKQGVLVSSGRRSSVLIGRDQSRRRLIIHHPGVSDYL